MNPIGLALKWARSNEPRLISISASVYIAVTEIYKTPTLKRALVQCIRIHNLQNFAVTFVLWIDTFRYVDTVIPANQMVEYFGGIVLDETETIRASAGADNILDLEIFGKEIPHERKKKGRK